MALLVALLLATGACNDDSPLATTSSGTSPDSATTLATTTTTEGLIELTPGGPPIISVGDRGEYVAALQWLLVCNGYDQLVEDGPTLAVDGVYGPITAAAVSYVQAQMRLVPTGEPDEALFAELSRRCNADRDIELPEDATEVRVAGNVAPGDDEVFIIGGRPGWTLSAEILEGTVQFVVTDSDGNTLKEAREDTPWSVELTEDRDYRIRVISSAAASFAIRIGMMSPPQVIIDFGPLVLEPTGLGIVEFGAEPTSVLEVLGMLLGEPDSDTGWEGGTDCEGFNRHLTYVIQPAEEGTDHPAVLTIHLSDVGFTDPSFAEYSYSSLDVASIDIGARALATVDGLSLGSTATEVTAAYARPTAFEDGSVTFDDGMLFEVAARGHGEEGEEDGDDEPVLVVSLIGAGQDGCPSG